LFVSTGGYHHHLGLNTWNGVGASPPPSTSVGLTAYTLVVPDEHELQQIVTRLGSRELNDPNGHIIHLTTMRGGEHHG
jgi:catechol 2,3-dioxygenase